MFEVKVSQPLGSSFIVYVVGVDLLNYDITTMKRLQAALSRYLTQGINDLVETGRGLDHRKVQQTMSLSYRIPPPVPHVRVAAVQRIVEGRARYFWAEVETRMMAAKAASAKSA